METYYLDTDYNGDISLIAYENEKYDFYQKGLVQTPVVSLNHIKPFLENRVSPLWAYYCCGPRTVYPNSFLAMPSYRVQILGFLLYNNVNAGVYVKNACIIMFPMSITMITTSILNSLNLEKHTLIYYLIGASFLMICIYFLPKYLGVYSLVLGLLLSYVTTAVLNLILIQKTCKIKPNYKRFILISLLFIIPSSLFGYFLKGVLLKFMPSLLAISISSFIVVIFCYLFYKIFNLYDIKVLLKK